MEELQDASLTGRAIAVLRDQPGMLRDFCGAVVLDKPQPMDPDRLAELSLPSGKPLPPSLRLWLAFDSSWLAGLGWFGDDGSFAPRTLTDIIRSEYGEFTDEESGFTSTDMWLPAADAFGECFLLADGTDSRRVFAVTEPDTLGEYPILVTDNDDGDFLAVMYPGLDVYLAEKAGVLKLRWGTYTDLAQHKEFGPRIRQHASRHPFNGATEGLDLWEIFAAAQATD